VRPPSTLTASEQCFFVHPSTSTQVKPNSICLSIYLSVHPPPNLQTKN